MRRIQFKHTYDDIISLENLLEAWKEFVRGKKRRKDVEEFELDLMSNIITLHRELADKIYKHSSYEFFKINDPKPRDIHKTKVRDRLLHHALYRKLYPFFDRTFISDSMSCRLGKGTHKAVNRFQAFAYKASKNHTKTVWVLKCDIRKFFASINQRTLLHIVHEHIQDKDILWLIQEIVSSFYSIDRQTGTGLPLGNLTSQLFVNIYMNKFDQFVKHKLKARHYIRYADDFVILSSDREWLLKILPKIQAFLKQKLFLDLHPDKISIETIYSGVDFLGWVHFPDHKILRTVTKKRMLRRIQAIKGAGDFEIIQSYLGLISHGNTKKLKQRIISN